MPTLRLLSAEQAEIEGEAAVVEAAAVIAARTVASALLVDIGSSTNKKGRDNKKRKKNGNNNNNNKPKQATTCTNAPVPDNKIRFNDADDETNEDDEEQALFANVANSIGRSSNKATAEDAKKEGRMPSSQAEEAGSTTNDDSAPPSWVTLQNGVKRTENKKRPRVSGASASASANANASVRARARARATVVTSQYAEKRTAKKKKKTTPSVSVTMPTWKGWREEQRENKAKIGSTHEYPPANPPRGTWVSANQQLQHRETQRNVTSSKVAPPNEIGFVRMQQQSPNITWLRRLKELRSYKAMHGHTDVPPSSSLGPWVARQRTEYRWMRESKSNNMTPNKIALLERLGFNWKRECKAKNGDTFGPQACPARETWASNQQQHHRGMIEGQSSKMAPERVSEWNEIGFVRIQQQSPNITWLRRLKELRSYKAMHGHTDVPPSSSLGPWVARQRTEYRWMRESKSNNMTPNKIALLERLGFNWKRECKAKSGDTFGPHECPARGTWASNQQQHHRGMIEGQSSKTAPEGVSELNEIGFVRMQQQSPNIPWVQRLEELRFYKAMHGHTDVPYSWSLGPWVARQRMEYRWMREGKPSSMTKKRTEALEDLGFNWKIESSSSYYGGLSRSSLVDKKAPSRSWKRKEHNIGRSVTEGWLKEQREHKAQHGEGNSGNTTERILGLLGEPSPQGRASRQLMDYRWIIEGKSTSNDA